MFDHLSALSEWFTVSERFMHKRRTAGISLVIPFSAALCLATLSGCGPTEKVLPSAQLKSELLTAPVGSKPYARGTLAPGGVLNSHQFVDGNFLKNDRSSEIGSITGDGFDYAVETNWDATDDTGADVFLLQFHDSDGAQGYVSDVSEATSEQVTPNEPLSSVSGVPGSEAWTAGSINSVGDIAQTCWTAVGDIVIEVHFFSPATADTPTFDQVVRDQYQRVTGSVDTPSPLPAPTGSAPAPQATAPASATTADRNRLRGDLVPLPHQAQPWPANSQDGPTGILTLAQYINQLDVPAAQKQQNMAADTERGIQYLVREDWNGNDDTQADLYLLQFSTTAGAQSYVLALQGSQADTVGTAGTYPVPGSGDAMAYETTKLDSLGNTYTEGYAVVGNVAIHLNFWVPAKTDRAKVIALLQQQYARLLADPVVAAAQRSAAALPTPAN